MKEIMRQYGQSQNAEVVAVLLFGIIGGTVTGQSKSIYTQTGQLVKQVNLDAVGENAEFERYWRLR